MIAKRVLYNGKVIYDRDNQGKFSSLKTKIARFIKRLAILVSVSAVSYALLYGAYTAGARFNPNIVMAEKIVDSSAKMFEEKIVSLKNGIADKLMACESSGKEGLITFDSNKKASIGQFQFQVSTVKYYYKTLYGKSITDKEAVLIALDSTQARLLAIDVMFNTKNMASKDWYNCEKKLGLDYQISIINTIK